MKGWIYGAFMRFAHRHGWHHIDRITLECGDVQYWCQWCGIREVRKHDHIAGMKIVSDERAPKGTIYFFNPQDFAADPDSRWCAKIENIQIPKDYHP